MLLSIPRRHTALHNMLGLQPIRDNLYGGAPNSIDDLRKVLENLASRRRIPTTTVGQILSHPWTEIRQSIDDVLTPIASTYHELVLEEFVACIDGSVNGVPAISAPPPTSTVIFEMDPSHRQIFPGPNRRGNFRIAPITNMRTVTVQRGYRREVNSAMPAIEVDVGFRDRLNANEKWYPGVDFLGEGLFIMLHDDDGWQFPITGPAVERWNRGFNERASYPEYVFRGPLRDELSPLFVWWHTLSHLLMRSAAIEAGYSAASIRERVYVQSDGGRCRGGIVLYATKPGSEGSLGGLMALAPYFDDILDTAFDMLATCSGDPLCNENEYTIGKYNGAACYGCLLASETSCEHRNMWLDRAVILENMP